MPLPNTARLNEVIDLLNETQGINNIIELATTIGPPAFRTQNIQEQIGHLQDAKNLLADNINSKGLSVDGTQNINYLARQVANIEQGVRYFETTVTSNNSRIAYQLSDGTVLSTYQVTVNNVGFIPRKISIAATANGNVNYTDYEKTAVNGYAFENVFSGAIVNDQTNPTFNRFRMISPITIQADNITLPVPVNNISYVFKAWE